MYITIKEDYCLCCGKMNKEEFRELIILLNNNKIKHIEHVDAGHTQVERGSVCMTTFFISKSDETIVKHLKLY